MSSRHFKVVTTCALALLFPAAIPQIGRAQSTGGQGNQQAISQTGLLPVYGVDFDFDPSWVDKAEFPPTSAVYPNYGTNAVFQKVWDALKPGGFNAIRFPVDVRDDKSAVNEIANLCVWAKNSGAHLVPVLIGCDLGQAPGPQYPGQAAKVVAAVVAALEKGASQNLQAYTQILCYQIENELNHAGLHGPGSPQSSGQLLLSAAAAVRKAEQDALKGSGLNATPLAINASFDYELINTGAIAGATLGDAAYSQAYDSTKRFLAALAASTDIDAVSIDWFPGSISAGTVDRFPALLHSLEADLPGKQIVLTTGFSTGFHSADEQKNFYALAFANLADYRAHEGISSPFAGLFFHGALNGAEANPSPPFADLPAGVSAWDWPARAAELKRMWNGNGTSDAVAWWLKKVTNSMGLASLSLDSSGSATVAIQPAAVGLSQIASSVSQGNTNAAASTGVNSTTASSPSGELAGSAVSTAQVPAGANSQGPAAVNPQSPSGAMAQTPGFGQSLAAELEKGLLGLMDHVFERVGSLIGGGGSGSGAAQYNPTQQSSQLPGGPSFGPGGGARLSISLSR